MARRYPNQTHDILRPPQLDQTGRPLARYAVLDNDGIVFAGARLKPRNVKKLSNASVEVKYIFIGGH